MAFGVVDGGGCRTSNKPGEDFPAPRRWIQRLISWGSGVDDLAIGKDLLVAW